MDADIILVLYYPAVDLEPSDRHTFNEGALVCDLNSQAAMIDGRKFSLITRGGSELPRGSPSRYFYHLRT